MDHRAVIRRLVAPLGMRLARQVTDLVGSHVTVQRDFPDQERRTGLARLAAAADLGVLHALAAAVLCGRRDDDAARAREQVDWSALHAEEAGLLDEAPLEPLRTAMRQALADHPRDVADRCWAQAREAHARGRASTVAQALALTWQWRSGDFPRLVVMVGPAGSGKSTFAHALPGVDAVVSLDDLRESRSRRSDQRANPAVLREGLHRVDALLAGGASVVWDATALNQQQQRALVHAVAERRDALTTHAVVLVPEQVLTRRNADRPHPVPAAVLAAQLRRFSPPWLGQAHRTWYIGVEGDVRDTAGELDSGQE